MPTSIDPDGKEVSQDQVPNDTESSLDAIFEHIATIKGWSFQYNQGTDDYSLFFGLLNDEEEVVSANVNVDIRIINDNGEEVFAATKSVTDNDFAYYESSVTGTQYLANIRIPTAEIKEGTSSDGTVYFTVYKGNTVLFDEVNCMALYCLPISDIELTVDNLPVEVKVKGYDGSTESIIKITEVSYTFEKEYTPQLKITLTGQKTYGNNSVYDIIAYKLYDSEEYLIDTGMVYLRSLDNGDKFKDNSIVIYDVIPGETYSLRLTEYSR
ncbi:MAG: hypothetical protein NC543_15960 [bacterium]|nr:hypothetical protein [bacterium]MCM1376697.1 hypothetical protein [Muribaculum sp.]